MISDLVTQMDPDLYDEFGNYVGPDLESEEEQNVRRRMVEVRRR